MHASRSAVLLLKGLGYADLAWIAADRAAQAALRLDDPLWIAVADYHRALALFAAGAHRPAARLAARSAETVPTASREGLEVRGMLLLTYALTAASGGSGGIDAALDEARQLAERTGQGQAFRFYFGPVNTSLWRMAVALEVGDTGRTIDVARSVVPESIPVRSRRVDYLVDYGRALASEKRIPEAVDRLRRAERLSPDQVRNNPLAREAVQGMLLRTLRTGGDRNLRGLAGRLGVVPR